MKGEKVVKLTGTVLAELVAVATLVKVIACGQSDRLFLAVITPLLVLLPMGMEKLLCCRLCLPLYVFALLYSVGPMLGQCWNFYYTISWWDKLLHIAGGVMFAIVGAFLFEKMAKGQQRPVVTALFALLFSISLSVLWEFAEFGADHFLGMDTQDDTIIHHITSHLLSDELGGTGRLDGITTVTINGTPLPFAGYIDIGLYDSMLDMLLESLGALITCALLWLDRGRHPLIARRG